MEFAISKAQNFNFAQNYIFAILVFEKGCLDLGHCSSINFSLA